MVLLLNGTVIAKQLSYTTEYVCHRACYDIGLEMSASASTTEVMQMVIGRLLISLFIAAQVG